MRQWLLGEDRLLGGKGMLTARAAEGRRMLLCGEGEQYSAYATGSFVLFVCVFIACAPERF